MKMHLIIPFPPSLVMLVGRSIGKEYGTGFIERVPTVLYDFKCHTLETE